jgi:hypothetical protein
VINGTVQVPTGVFVGSGWQSAAISPAAPPTVHTAGVGDGVGVNVAVGGGEVTITSCGALAPSLLLKLVAVLLVVVITTLYVPAPATSAVTFTLVQVLAVMAPELPTLLPKGGSLLKGDFDADVTPAFSAGMYDKRDSRVAGCPSYSSIWTIYLVV